ncbi:MAG TPA: response regulator [Stellaceae bacterium]
MPRTETSHWTVLVVDDDPDVRQYAASVLDEAGYRVLTAADGESALAVVERDDSIDVLFTDVVMPGINGFELARAATAQRPSLKVLFASGYATDLTPAGQLLKKPYRPLQLTREIESLLPRPAA